jgi:hypothetical protein
MQTDKAEFVAALHRQGADPDCPICHVNDWKKPEGYFLTVIEDAGSVMEGHGTPVIALVCENCGFCRLHASGVLGFFPGP